MKIRLLLFLSLFFIAAALDPGFLPNTVYIYPPAQIQYGCVWSPIEHYMTFNSSVTSCVQEGFDYAFQHGFDIEVFGGTQPGSGGAVVYNFQAPLKIPPLQGKKIVVGAATFNFATDVGAAPCVQFNSMMMVELKFSGQIVCWGTGAAINFYPSGPVPVDKVVVITSCRMSFVAVVCQNSQSACIQFDIHLGSIMGNHFEFIEVNGSYDSGTKQGAPEGIAVVRASATTAFESNLMDVANIHLVTSAGVQIGTNQANQQGYRGNVWRIAAIRPHGAGASGFNSFGSYDNVQLGNINQEEGPCQYGVYFQHGSVSNRVYGKGVLVPTPWTNFGSDNVWS